MPAALQQIAEEIEAANVEEEVPFGQQLNLPEDQQRLRKKYEYNIHSTSLKKR